MKTINLYCIRHGEATHNILYKQLGMEAFFDENFYDTELTDKGFNQSIELGNIWNEKNNIDLVIVSPLSRTLQTAMNIFKNTSTKIVAYDFLKEYPQGKHTCNKRKNKTVLINKFPQIDFLQLDSDEDKMWNPDSIESIDSLLQRINKMYDFIDMNNYKNIALVGHNSYISMMKYGKFFHQEEGEEELKYCFPYKMELKFD